MQSGTDSKVFFYSKKNNLILPGDQVLLAFSGGADSLYLLYFLIELQKHIAFSLEAMHIHHGIREEEAERDVLREREEALARELAAMRSKKKKLVDPIQYALSIAAEDLTSYEPTFPWEMGPPSEKQLAFLENRGILPDTVENAGLASLLIDRLKRRQEEGLATPKQIRCLERYGFRRVGTWQFDTASALISRLAMNHWRVPQGMTPSVYTP